MSSALITSLFQLAFGLHAFWFMQIRPPAVSEASPLLPPRTPRTRRGGHRFARRWWAVVESTCGTGRFPHRDGPSLVQEPQAQTHWMWHLLVIMFDNHNLFPYSIDFDLGFWWTASSHRNGTSHLSMAAPAAMPQTKIKLKSPQASACPKNNSQTPKNLDFAGKNQVQVHLWDGRQFSLNQRHPWIDLWGGLFFVGTFERYFQPYII